MSASPSSLPRRIWAALTAPAAPLVLGVARIGFGLMMALSAARFLALGWAGPLYAEPAFHFTYPGFGWVRPLPLPALQAVLALQVVAALLVAWGRRTRLWLAVFSAAFLYTELIDAALYLNHYYFASAFGLLLLVLPSGAALVPHRPDRRSVPAWTVWALRVQVGLVYFFAGVAKLYPDWLLDAMPLRLWLAARAGLPVVGGVLGADWTPWAMAWAGALFDLAAPFLLAWRPARPYAYAGVVVFHAITYALFNIGVFPLVMVAAALVFFEADEWRALGRRVPTLPFRSAPPSARRPAARVNEWTAGAVAGWLVVQLLLPWRHLLYPGDRLWTEEGFRFAWHVMVAEKTGQTAFHVLDPATNERWTIRPGDELTPLQEKQMAFQPDLLWQYAQHLERRFHLAGHPGVEVRAEAYASVNGGPTRLLIDPDIDLTRAREASALNRGCSATRPDARAGYAASAVPFASRSARFFASSACHSLNRSPTCATWKPCAWR